MVTVAEEKLATDVFCEERFLYPDETEKIVEAGKRFGDRVYMQTSCITRAVFGKYKDRRRQR